MSQNILRNFERLRNEIAQLNEYIRLFSFCYSFIKELFLLSKTVKPHPQKLPEPLQNIRNLVDSHATRKRQQRDNANYW